MIPFRKESAMASVFVEVAKATQHNILVGDCLEFIHLGLNHIKTILKMLRICLDILLREVSIFIQMDIKNLTGRSNRREVVICLAESTSSEAGAYNEVLVAWQFGSC
jgi:hypothetical protein